MDLEKSSLQSLRASTGPEQGFPCVVFSHRENPVFIAGIPANENRVFPVGYTTRGKPCFHYRDGFAVLFHLSLLCVYQYEKKLTKNIGPTDIY